MTLKSREEAYHKSRIMFAVLNEEVKYSLNDERGHQQWLEETYSITSEVFENIVRGYVKDSFIVFYRGSSFESVSYEVMNKYLPGIVKDLCLDLNGYEIWLGVYPAEVGKIWRPRVIVKNLK